MIAEKIPYQNIFVNIAQGTFKPRKGRPDGRV